MRASLIKYAFLCRLDLIYMEELIIREYFRKGYSYTEIVRFLEHCHGIKISLRTLKSRLKAYGLRRRGRYTNDHIEQVVESVGENIRTHGGISISIY